MAQLGGRSSQRAVIHRDPAEGTNHKEERAGLANDKLIHNLAQWAYEKARHEHYCINNAKVLQREPERHKARIELIAKLEELIQETRAQLLARGMTEREIEEQLLKETIYLRMLKLRRERDDEPHEDVVGSYLPAGNRFQLHRFEPAVLEKLLTAVAPKGAIFIRAERRALGVELVDQEVLELRAYDRSGKIIEANKLRSKDLLFQR